MLILCPIWQQKWLADSIHLSIHKSHEIYGLFPNGFPKVCWVSWQRDSNSGWSRYRTERSPTGPYMGRLFLPASWAWLTWQLHKSLWTWGYLWHNPPWLWPSSGSCFLNDSISAAVMEETEFHRETLPGIGFPTQWPQTLPGHCHVHNSRLRVAVSALSEDRP